MANKALIVVDFQNDFCPNGALAVPDGDQILDTVNDLVEEFTERGDIVIYTKDFHPENHVSFADNHPEGIWPPHCVQGTTGAEFFPELTLKGPTFLKGFVTEQDSYSGFGGHVEADVDSQSLEDYLKEQSIEEVTVVGLALDYCVKSTALDAQKLGFPSTVVLSGTKAVNVEPDDDEKAIEELKAAGVKIK